MTQPSFVPIAEADQVRPARRLHVPEPWTQARVAELRTPGQPTGARFGTPGPDQGFALRLARSVADRLRLTPGEEEEDVLVGLALIATRRAGRFGRAPSVYDVRFAANLWGFLGAPAAELVEARRAAFRSVSHDYAVQRELVDSVPEALLAATPERVAELAGSWRAPGA